MRTEPKHYCLAGGNSPFVEVGPDYRVGGVKMSAADVAEQFEIVRDGVHRTFSATELDDFLRSRRGGGDDGIEAVTAAMLKEPESTFNL